MWTRGASSLQKSRRCLPQSLLPVVHVRSVIPGRRRIHDDPTLVWARMNPEQAQLCLQPPPWDVRECDPSFWDQKSKSMEGYCQWRRWKHTGAQEEKIVLREKTLAITSHILSAPLTFAIFASRKEFRDNSRFCCVGARAEATIPFDIWREYLLLSSAISGKPVASSLDFVGPDIVTTPGETPNRTVQLESSSSSLDLKWHFKGLLHDLLAKNGNATDDWDAFVFFNPGFGHPNLKQDWHSTLEKVIPLGRPMLLTAHSKFDAQRDSEHLKNQFGLTVKYVPNQFASRISYEDPFDKSHRVSPNHYVAHVITNN